MWQQCLTHLCSLGREISLHVKPMSLLSSMSQSVALNRVDLMESTNQLQLAHSVYVQCSKKNL